ncbi:hypothetical protein [Leptospira perdikensis]|uniref:Uncharacterized protein n=1 Tax=Leptospira perdikensis TaxID=2484948 RepID=A0A4R9JHN3_9LEPT|nr:hypothetical protein [Leptospira perdikensis]TGL44150.1 hypothetical protein EHQ49_01310 [Leptospira perdikensis]
MTIQSVENFKFNIRPISKSEIAKKTAMFDLELVNKVGEGVIFSFLNEFIHSLREEKIYTVLIISCYDHDFELVEFFQKMNLNKIFEIDSWPTKELSFSKKNFYHLHLEDYN